MSESFIITAVPSEKSYNTTFAFEYYSDGEAHSGLVRLYYALFVVPENGTVMLIVACVILGLMVLLCICCCVCIMRKRAHKNALPPAGGAHELIEADFSSAKPGDETAHDG